jgi:hypothetical protein
MKRTPLARKTPLKTKTALKPGGKPLRTHKPIARGAVKLRAVKPKADKPKRAAREAADRDLMALCKGQPCYLLVPGLRCAPVDTVVACHSNQYAHGKGKGVKAHNLFTVPGCATCHREIDQGARLTREEKFALWDDAYRRWEPIRRKLSEASHQ